MSEYDVADRVYNQDGELEQFLLLWEESGPETRRATPENKLLFDPEDELEIEGGLRDFIDGESALKLSDNPRTVVAQAGNEYSFIVSVGGNIVETTPEDAKDVLEATYTALSGGGTLALHNIHTSLMSERVRQDLVNTLVYTFKDRSRIDITPEGWLVDGLYLVDWSAKLYAKTDDDRSFQVRGGDAVESDKSHEFVVLSQGTGTGDPPDVTISGDTYSLSEREDRFLGKVKWLLHRRFYHPDNEFWMFADRWADVDEKTGEPISDDTYDIDQYNV